MQSSDAARRLRMKRASRLSAVGMAYLENLHLLSGQTLLAAAPPVGKPAARRLARRVCFPAISWKSRPSCIQRTRLSRSIVRQTFPALLRRASLEDAALGRDDWRGFRVPPIVEPFQRQYTRQAAPVVDLRAWRTARRAHGIRWRDYRREISSAASTCRSVARTSVSAVVIATVCSWRRPGRSMRSM